MPFLQDMSLTNRSCSWAVASTVYSNQVLFRVTRDIVVSNRANVAVSTREEFGLTNGLGESDIVKVHHVAHMPKMFVWRRHVIVIDRLISCDGEGLDDDKLVACDLNCKP